MFLLFLQGGGRGGIHAGHIVLHGLRLGGGQVGGHGGGGGLLDGVKLLYQRRSSVGKLVSAGGYRRPGFHQINRPMVRRCSTALDTLDLASPR